MPKPKRTILIIENQQSQQDEISSCLRDHYVVCPDDRDFVYFIDNVRVWVNKEYDDGYREKALKYIIQVLNDENRNVELILMDHKLGGAHECNTGIDLARALNEARKTTDSLFPVIFISKTEHTDKNRITDFDSYQNDYPNTSEWVHKGYFGDEILERAFLEKNVIPKIESLLKKSIAIQIIEKLNENKPKITSTTSSTEREIVEKTIALVDEITQGKAEATNELLSRLSEDQLDSQYLELLKSKLVNQ